jgi:hypothetical protein
MGFVIGRFVDQVMNISSSPTGEALKAVALSHLILKPITIPLILFFSTILPVFSRAIRM